MSECATCTIELEPMYSVIGICLKCLQTYCPLCLEWWDDCVDTADEVQEFVGAAMKATRKYV